MLERMDDFFTARIDGYAWNKGATEISLDATESGRPLYKKCGFEDSEECMILAKK